MATEGGARNKYNSNAYTRVAKVKIPQFAVPDDARNIHGESWHMTDDTVYYITYIFRYFSYIFSYTVPDPKLPHFFVLKFYIKN